jgi:hypothetical protein
MTGIDIKKFREAGGLRVASACDPIYGITDDRLTERITQDNWETKALWRMAIAGPVYVYVDYNPDWTQPGKPLAYRVLCALYDYNDNKLDSFGETCADLEAAINYANGEGHTPLAALTRAADEDEYPDSWRPGFRIAIPLGKRP